MELPRLTSWLFQRRQILHAIAAERSNSAQAAGKNRYRNGIIEQFPSTHSAIALHWLAEQITQIAGASTDFKTHQTRAERRSGAPTSNLDIPKIPTFIQRQVDSAIEKSKHDELTDRQQHELEELLEYIDDQSIYELRKVKSAHA